MRSFKRIVIVLNVIFLIFIAVFITQNSDVATIKFLFWTYESSLSIILFSTFILGIVIGLLFLVPLLIKGKKKNNNNAGEVKSEYHG